MKVTERPLKRTIRMSPGVEADIDPNGQVVLSIPCRLLSGFEMEALDTLFPNTQNQVEKLLATEALIEGMEE